MGKPVKVTMENLEREAKKAAAAILDFSSIGCSPCKKYEPIFDELAGEYDGRAFVGKVDISTQPAVAQAFGVMSVPTILFLKNGEISERIVGVVPKKQLTDKLDKLLI